MTPTLTMVTTTVSSSGARCWIKASPRGTRSGFAVLPDGAGGQVTVTVLPKPWSSRTGAVREYAHSPGATTHVVVHETELAAVATSAASAGVLAINIADLSPGQADLLGIGAASEVPAVSSDIPTDPFGDLVDLMLLAERGGLAASPLTFEGSFGPALLRLLTQERLVKVVESLIFRARPRYAERTETLEIPRGRLSERSLLFSAATGIPRVESTYDDLTMNTPLLQVVASALRVIASERLPRKVSALRPALQTRAVHLLRHLSNVSLIDRERALLEAERLWITTLDRIWQPAIDAALPVLRDRAVVPKDGTESSEAILIRVSTEKFWEQCVGLALESAFETVAVSADAQPGEGVSVPAPWAPKVLPGPKHAELPTEIFPDFMFRARHQVVVADAKYKLGSGDTPSSADGYQLFVYSHLATLGGRPSDLSMLFYPTRPGSPPRQLALERLRDRDYPLWLIRMPFPTRLDVHNQSNWGAYVARLATAIREFSLDWMTRSGETHTSAAREAPSDAVLAVRSTVVSERYSR